ncbi:MAG: single-stranded DNA-binding protein [Oscillospiraceae bacterium]|nr:single-stranded DNA-binding protein [Oscillospiraceae bacterium]
MNTWTGIGRLGRDVELKTTQSGIEYCNFSVAINRPIAKDKTQIVDWIPCTAWRQTAVVISKYCKKGDQIGITGELQSRKYTDKDGKERTAYEIAVNRVDLPARGSGTPVPAEAPLEPTWTPAGDAVDVDGELPF